MRVWGARGSSSARGPATVGYGGNTWCAEVEFAFPVGLAEAPAEAVWRMRPASHGGLGAHSSRRQWSSTGGRRSATGSRTRDACSALAAGADLLLHDSQYTDHEYTHRSGWGHSSITHAATFARSAGVRRLALFHHDPMRSDREFEELYDEVAEIVEEDQESPLIASEGLEVRLDGEPAQH